MITRNTFVPNGLEWRFGSIRLVEQVHRTQTHQGGARDHTIGVQNAARPEGFCHNLQLLLHIVVRDLVKMSADHCVCPSMKPAANKFTETLPMVAWKLLEGYNWHNSVRFRRHVSDERSEIGLGRYQLL
jgi:hypothetical protein